MRITERVHLVGSGSAGFDLTDALDCHVYLGDGSGAWALIDAGAGRDPDRVAEQVRFSGVDTARPGHLLLTHSHGDHAGSVAAVLERFPALRTRAGAAVAAWVRAGDERGISLNRANLADVYPPDYIFRPAGAVSKLDVLSPGQHEVGLNRAARHVQSAATVFASGLLSPSVV